MLHQEPFWQPHPQMVTTQLVGITNNTLPRWECLCKRINRLTLVMNISDLVSTYSSLTPHSSSPPITVSHLAAGGLGFPQMHRGQSEIYFLDVLQIHMYDSVSTNPSVLVFHLAAGSFQMHCWYFCTPLTQFWTVRHMAEPLPLEKERGVKWQRDLCCRRSIKSLWNSWHWTLNDSTSGPFVRLKTRLIKSQRKNGLKRRAAESNDKRSLSKVFIQHDTQFQILHWQLRHCNMLLIWMKGKVKSKRATFL